MRLPISLLSAGGAGLAALGRATWRFRVVQSSPTAQIGTPANAELCETKLLRATGRLEHAVYGLWHEHLLPLAVLHAGQEAAVLVSRHRDGEIVSRVLNRLGYHPVRGSTTRGGAAGLRALIEVARAGHPVAFTPDGPRGPRRRCQPGIVHAAAATELPIVPVGVAVTAGWQLNSWDRFLIPAPGTTVLVSYGEPLHVPAPEALEGVDTWALRIAQAIDGMIARCEEQLRRRLRSKGGGEHPNGLTARRSD